MLPTHRLAPAVRHCRLLPPPPQCLFLRVPFHSTSCQRSPIDEMTRKTHYQRLNVPTNASPATIKKSFYALSKAHHPDTNPSPTSAPLFSLLSESYTILSNASRRAAYDRDTLHLHAKHHHHHPSGSYASSNPAGGRPASGLSRRRGSFRGPPPSFYRNGAWGAHADRRRREHENTTGAADAAAAAQRAQAAREAAEDTLGGMGPGSNPFKDAERARATPHFDSEAHTRTHERQDERRWQRRRRAVDDEDIEFEPQASLGAHFLIVAGILGATVVAPMVYLQFLRLQRHKKEV